MKESRRPIRCPFRLWLVSATSTTSTTETTSTSKCHRENLVWDWSLTQSSSEMHPTLLFSVIFTASVTTTTTVSSKYAQKRNKVLVSFFSVHPSYNGSHRLFDNSRYDHRHGKFPPSTMLQLYTEHRWHSQCCLHHSWQCVWWSDLHSITNVGSLFWCRRYHTSQLCCSLQQLQHQFGWLVQRCLSVDCRHNNNRSCLLCLVWQHMSLQ